MRVSCAILRTADKSMLRVAIVGCGKIADAHVAQIQRVSGCEIVGVCDREELMAKQLFERFPIKGYFSDIKAMLTEAQPDVVHITTPPQSHFEIAKICLNHGCHLYVEKPFTLNTAQAVELIAVAQQRELKVTVGHDEQFSHVARRMRQYVRAGFLGGEPVHMESYFCYDLSDPAYAKAFLSDKEHWLRKLPGKLLHNIISHGIARIAEFFPDDAPEVVAHGFISPRLRSMGEAEIVDELRVLIYGAGGHTAYFTFSSQMRPSLHQFRIYGAKNSMILDEDHQVLLKCTGKRLKSYAEKFVAPIRFSTQYYTELAGNLRRFLRNDFHVKAGMKCLIESFYASVTNGAPVPIAYREILLTSRIMDGIFKQLNDAAERGKDYDTTIPSDDRAQGLEVNQCLSPARVS
jgi:predicted dehydrogenase